MFSFPPATEMFHFAGCPPLRYVFTQQYLDLPSRWVYPFGNPRITGCLPPSRGLSQATTSFIGFLCQGIHHTLLNALFPIFDFILGSYSVVKVLCYSNISNRIRMARIFYSHHSYKIRIIRIALIKTDRLQAVLKIAL